MSGIITVLFIALEIIAFYLFCLPFDLVVTVSLLVVTYVMRSLVQFMSWSLSQVTRLLGIQQQQQQQQFIHIPIYIDGIAHTQKIK